MLADIGMEKVQRYSSQRVCGGTRGLWRNHHRDRELLVIHLYHRLCHHKEKFCGIKLGNQAAASKSSPLGSHLHSGIKGRFDGTGGSGEGKIASSSQGIAKAELEEVYLRGLKGCIRGFQADGDT